MNVFGLLTGRGINTLKDKNLLPIKGYPLITYPARAALKVIDRKNLFVSSDDDKILDSVSQYGFKAIKRPSDISGPSAQHIDAIRHALQHIQELTNVKVDILVVMLANSATIKPEWINAGIDLIRNNPSISAVVPAYVEQDHHPYRAKALDADGFLKPYFDFENIEISSNRQELPENYFLSHNFWVLNIPLSLELNDGYKPWTFMGQKVRPIVVDDCFDVHTLTDIERSLEWINRNIGDDEIY